MQTFKQVKQLSGQKYELTVVCMSTAQSQYQRAIPASSNPLAGPYPSIPLSRQQLSVWTV